MSGLPHLRDLSSYQPVVDWSVEKREVVAVYVKVSQGLTYVNPFARAQLAAARKAGIMVGGYHFCTPGVGSGEQQADRLISLAPARLGSLRPCLDCEANLLALNQGQLGAWYLAAVTRIVERLGCFPTIYGSKDYLQNMAATAPGVFGRCPLWIASYNPAPSVPAPWHSWQAWQHTPGLRDPAIPAPVDDSFVADLKALRVPGVIESLRVKQAARSLKLSPWQLKPPT